MRCLQTGANRFGKFGNYYTFMIDMIFVIQNTLFGMKNDINDSLRKSNAQKRICLPELISITGWKKSNDLIFRDFIGK